MFSANIPEGIRSKLMRAYIRHLQSNPVLSGLIKTWDDMPGTAEDHRVIPLERCPAIRFTYSAPGPFPQTFTSQKADFVINMEVILPGTNQYAMIDTWEVIEAATDQFFTLDKKFREVVANDPRYVFGTAFLSNTAINHNKYRNPPCLSGTGALTIVGNIRR
jgi:hypothetical protein